MHHQHGAHTLTEGFDDELLQRRLRVGLNHAVEIYVVLDRELPTPQPG